MKASQPADEDRLPWLEPYRETKKPGKPLPRRGYARPVALGAGAALLLAVGAGGYWFGQRAEAPQPRSSETIALPPAPKPPPAQPAPVEVAEAPPQPESAQAVAEQPEAKPVKAAKPKIVKKKRVTHRHRPVRRKIRTAGVQHERIDAVRKAQEDKPVAAPAAPPVAKPVARPWPKMPSPGPAGQVIQLGAFTTPARANNAYRARIARYPALARMPRVVVPVITRPSGRVLYVLRLGTTSRQQSKTVCRNLLRSGDHCLVIG